MVQSSLLGSQTLSGSMLIFAIHSCQSQTLRKTICSPFLHLVAEDRQARFPLEHPSILHHRTSHLTRPTTGLSFPSHQKSRPISPVVIDWRIHSQVRAIDTSLTSQSIETFAIPMEDAY